MGLVDSYKLKGASAEIRGHMLVGLLVEISRIWSS